MVETDIGEWNHPTLKIKNPAWIHSKESFHQWWNEDSKVNKRVDTKVKLCRTNRYSDIYQYISNAFFPVDNNGWNKGKGGRNFHFTMEMHLHFLYEGGEIFNFSGDDDVWVFLNGKLAIDLGGVHGRRTQNVRLDSIAKSHGFTKGTFTEWTSSSLKDILLDLTSRCKPTWDT